MKNRYWDNLNGIFYPKNHFIFCKILFSFFIFFHIFLNNYFKNKLKNVINLIIIFSNKFNRLILMHQKNFNKYLLFDVRIPLDEAGKLGRV